MTLKFGELEKVATDDGFIWYAQTWLKSEIFGQVPFCLVSTESADVDKKSILLAERIASDIDRYVKEALGFLKDELRRGHFLNLMCQFANYHLARLNAPFMRVISSG